MSEINLPESGLENEDLGLTEEEFAKQESRRERKISEMERQEREMPERLYFIFPDHRQQTEALRLIGEYRQADERFAHLTGWKPDSNPQKQDVGIELDFAHHPKGLEQSLREFFTAHELELREKIYKVIEMRSVGGKEERTEEEDIAA